jgi:hypothetical protein
MGKAQEWRRQTIKGLESKNENSSSTEDGSEQLDALHLREQYYEKIADLIFTRARPVLLKTDKEESRRHRYELLEIIRSAGELAARLFTHRVKMNVICSWDRADDAFRFDIRSSIMTPHTSMLLDEDSHEFDGHIVSFMVEPAIIAYGNEAGRNYHEWKVFMKMTVLVFDGCEKKDRDDSDCGETKRRNWNGSIDELKELGRNQKRIKFGGETESASIAHPTAAQQLLDAAGETGAQALTDLETSNTAYRTSMKEWRATSSSSQTSSRGDEKLLREVAENEEIQGSDHPVQELQRMHERQEENLKGRQQWNPQQHHESEAARRQGLLSESFLGNLIDSISADKPDAVEKRQQLAKVVRGKAISRGREDSQARLEANGSNGGAEEKVRTQLQSACSKITVVQQSKLIDLTNDESAN